jgi:hypothetical protein
MSYSSERTESRFSESDRYSPERTELSSSESDLPAVVGGSYYVYHGWSGHWRNALSGNLSVLPADHIAVSTAISLSLLTLIYGSVLFADDKSRWWVFLVAPLLIVLTTLAAVKTVTRTQEIKNQEILDSYDI